MSGFAPGKGKKYRYSYRIISPAGERGLQFSDGRIAVAFTIDEAAVVFRLQNTTKEPLSILWERASIGVDSSFSRVRHASDLYAVAADNLPFVLPPGGFVRDLVIPWNNISFDGTVWRETDLFATSDAGLEKVRAQILSSRGKRLRVVLPIQFANDTHEYAFVFEVSNVTETRWRDVVPTQREPKPPKSGGTTATIDTLTLALVGIGFVALVAFFAFAEKAPIQE